MSWTKPGQGGASPGPPQYGAPQPQSQSYGNQQNVYANYGSGVGNHPQQQQYWQMGQTQQQPPQVQYDQRMQYGQVLQPNTNQFYQQPAAATPTPLFNQNYANQGYMNPQQNVQQNYYQNQPLQNQPHQNFTQNAPRKDAWEDNWDWGWEDTAKQAHNAQQSSNRPAMQPEQAFNNANMIEESFGTNETWSWSTDDKKDNEPSPLVQQENSQIEPLVNTVQNEVIPDPIVPPNLNGTRHHTEEVRNLRDRDVIKERLPNLATGRRLQLDNLTPQWSIESQMSQESSDGPHTHSEGTYRSENQSRNSNSPAAADTSNLEYSQPSFDDGYPPNDEWSRHSDEPTLAESDRGSRRESRDDLTDSLQEMSLSRPQPATPTDRRESRTLPDNIPPPPAASPGVPAPIAPPPTFPPAVTPATSSHNPFKNTGSFSHLPRPSPSVPGLTATAGRTPLGFEANLETMPDNSERPDRPAVSPYRSPPVPEPDNLEVAPRTDRNEYMATAHLSSGAGDYGENAQYAPPPHLAPAPPPGLRRLVVGVGEERTVPGRHTEPGERRYRQAEGRPRPPGEAGPEPRLPPPSLERGSPGDGAAPPPPVVELRDNVTEGENLQDPEPAAPPPHAEVSPVSPSPPPPRRDSTPHDSDRDRSFDERDRTEPRRDRDRPREDDGRYSRSDRDGRKYERGTRDAPDRDRRTRRSQRHRYETEDTDYYSDRDRDRDRRSHREGSYAGKPPRGDHARRTTERRYEEERPRDRDRDRDRYERRYRDIDPSRKYGNLRRERDRDHHDTRRRAGGDSPSREATATDEDTSWDRRDRDRRDRDPDRRDRERRRRERSRERARLDPYYEAVSQRRQYEYYERLRATDPAAYMQLYKQLMGGSPHVYGAQYAAHAAPYVATDDRGSVHSGRSSAAGLKGTDTYYGYRGEAGSLRDAPSLITDLSDRDLNTDASLNLQLEESTVRSERMTPFRYSTAHVKGSISSRDVVVVVPSYPVDGAAAVVRVVRVGLAAPWPALGPVRAPLAHKRSALEYCTARARAAKDRSEGAPDSPGYALVWDLLATMLRQNGVVVGTDLAEILMRNVREFEWRQPSGKSSHNESRRESSVSGAGSADDATPEHDTPRHRDTSYDSATRPESGATDEKSAMDKYREYLIYGNRQEALEYAMESGLWAHALALAASGSGRARAAAAARFLAALPPADPLRTLYAAHAGAAPPLHAAGDWRVHAAVLLANPTQQPQADLKSLIQLGDTLSSLGSPYSAQFVWVCAGAEWAPHPLAPHPPRAGAGAGAGAAAGAAPARLSLLLHEPRASSWRALVAPHAVLATEVYEYARGLAPGAEGFSLPTLQVYRLGAALALADGAQYARALAYCEAAARAVAGLPAAYPAAFLRALHALADRLRPHDPSLDAHDWIQDLQAMADATQAGSAAPGPLPHSTPLHQPQPLEQPQPQYAWDQSQHYQQQAPTSDVNQTYASPTPPPAQEYAHYAPPPPLPAADEQPPLYSTYNSGWPAPAPAAPADIPAPAGAPPSYSDYSWHQEQYSYGEEGAAAPTITMPGAASAGGSAAGGGAGGSARAAYGDYDDDRPYGNGDEQSTENDTSEGASNKTSKSSKKKEEGGGGKGGGWLGGLFGKLSLRPPNQMILPDDKNPTIVWDEQAKRWRNTDGGDEEVDQPPPPPPSNRELAANPPRLTRQTASPPLQSTPGAPPTAPPVSNIFKMQKGRHIKKSYVDVFNPPGAGGTAPRPPAAEVLGPPGPSLAAQPHDYFVPAAQPAQGGVYDPNEEEPYRSGI